MKEASPRQSAASTPPEPIAIIGIGCRYPGASNVDELWEMMATGKETICPYPGGRFATLDSLYEEARRKPGRVNTDRGGFLQGIDGFDSQFFEISPRESIYIDPQHRLLLEVAQEALDDAGQVRANYSGSATGVYTGLWTSEYETRLNESATEPDFYSVTGCGRSSASGRLSFMFGLEGPSVTVDTACSSSLVAVHMACQALWAGDIEMALAGGANLILGPEISELFTRAKMLSPDGSCKFGDASANGFVRSEGAGMVVLKRLSQAQADGDSIYAVIRGGAVNNDGRSSGLLVTPSREGQRDMLRAAWTSAGIDPKDLCYIEMHGTGTSVGDPVEVEAVGAALADAGAVTRVPLGSIKTNIGHAESASGVAGLIKVALALKHRIIPPSLHFKTPNPNIAWDRFPVRVAAETIDLQLAATPLIAGVNSFGITGTNAHLVLAEPDCSDSNDSDPREESSESDAGAHGPYLLPLSARGADALKAVMKAHLILLESVGESSLGDICYTAALRRNHYEDRAAVVGGTLGEMKLNLAASIAGEEAEGVTIGHTVASPGKVVFVAPGQGSQWAGMARELFATEVVFRRTFEQCDAAIATETGWSLIERVLGPEAERFLTQIDVIQPALFVMSVALAAVWRARGVEPDAVVGHSMGEVAAAHIAGILTLRDAVAVICRRSQLMKTLSKAGSMATVELPLREVQALLASRNGISIGASNGPTTTVVSGDSKAVDALLEELRARDIYCRQIKVDVASHSAQVDPILDRLAAQLSEIQPQPARISMLSTVTGEFANTTERNGAVLDGPYWVENLRRPVLFAPAIERLAAGGHDTFIELSPHPILLPSIEASARKAGPEALALASLRREKPESATLLAAFAALYVSGRPVAWERLYPGGGRCVRLPQYPFQRERCWPEPADASSPRPARESNRATPLLGRRFESSLQPGSIVWEKELSVSAIPYLGDHRVMRSAVFPAAGYVEMALSAARDLFPDEAFEVRNATFESAAYLPEQGSKIFQIALTPEGERFRFEIRTKADGGEAAWPLRSRGVLERSAVELRKPKNASIATLQKEYPSHRDAADHYSRTLKSGLQYGPAFQMVKEAWVGEGESLCRLDSGSVDRTGSVLHPALLDACFQAIAHVRPEGSGFTAEDTFLPVGINLVRLYRDIPDDGEFFAQAKLTGSDPEQGTFCTDIRLLDTTGTVLMDVSAMELKRVARENSAASAESLYRIEWVKQSPAEHAPGKAEANILTVPRASSERWLVFADDQGVAEQMQASLEFIGGRCVLVRPGGAFRKTGESEFEVNPGERRDLDLLLDEFVTANAVPTAVIHLWSLNAMGSGPYDPYDVDRLLGPQALGAEYVPWLVQAVSAANWQNPPRLWLVTGGVASIEGDAVPSIEQSPMWGIGRSVARENPELRATVADLSASPGPEEARALALEVCTQKKEDWLAIRGNAISLARISRIPNCQREERAAPLGAGENYRLEIAATGIFDNLVLRAIGLPAPGAGEIAIEVSEAGLNFSDVTKAMGLYPGLTPGQAIPMGNEAVGKVIAIGEDVKRFRVGDEVIALTPSMRTTGTIATAVVVPAELALHKPAILSREEAATVAVVYLTAYWSLVEQARIRKGEWVLIHAGAGGVGLAAIEIAKWAGAKIIATVGSKEKEEYLRSLGVAHVLDSRSTSFAAGVMEITGGRGVDVLLNSLAGELLAKSFEVIAPYGRFIELGKRDVHGDTRVGLRVFRNNVSFHVVDVAAAIEDRRSYVAELLATVMRHIESGEWRPLPVRSFSSAEPGEPFRFMAQARHIGKISIRMDRDVRVLPRTDKGLFSANASYLITGGMGGVGLTVAEWMARNGAGQIVLVSRRKPSKDALEAIRRIEDRAAGTKIVPMTADITSQRAIEDIVRTVNASGLPLRGIMHAAAVIDDALIADLSPERFLPVLAPKMTGTWNLHIATLQAELDFFVLFSSIAAVHPQPGMGSYAAANAFLDAFAQYRRASGLPAISVNWGGWDQIGLARAAGTGRSIEGYEQQGMRNYSGDEALAALGRALEENPTQAIAVPFDWEKFAGFYGGVNIPQVFSSMMAQVGTDGAQAARSKILDSLFAAEPGPERRETMEAYLQEVLGRVLKLATHRIDRDRPLGSMGLDSLMGLEFVRRLSNAFEIAVPATVVFNYPTVKLLAANLLRRLHLDAENAHKAEDGAHVGSPESEALSANGTGELTEAEALQALIGFGQGGS